MTGREDRESKLIPEALRAFNRARSVLSTEEGPSPMAGHFSLTLVGCGVRTQVNNRAR